MRPTIFAPINAFGGSVISIRISGPEAFNALKALRVESFDLMEYRRCYVKNLYTSNGDFLDQSLITLYKEGESFTGDIVAEISLHGSRFIFEEVCKILSNVPNIRFAEPGEFLKNSFLNGKLTVFQAEGIADLIASESALQHKLAYGQFSGKIALKYNSWRNELIEIISNLESVIDFSDEYDVPKETENSIQSLIEGLINSISNEVLDKTGEKIRDGFQVVILGKPNVGKSSLLNAVAGNDVAIVSRIPGTTRDVLCAKCEIGGFIVNFYDTAGIRETTDEIEKEGIERAARSSKNADCKVWVFEDLQSINEFIENDYCVSFSEIKDFSKDNDVIVLNKLDLLSGLNLEHIYEHMSAKGVNFCAISASNLTGIDDFRAKLSENLIKIAPSTSSSIVTRQRHRAHLEKCLHFLRNFNLQNGIDIACENLRLAAREISKIEGYNISNDDVLSNIFSKFCIGK